MRKLMAGLSALALWGLSATAVMANPTLLGDPFRDHAVVQRDKPISVWGDAAPGAQVSVSLNGHSVTATANDQGEWRAALPALPAGGPYVLEAKSGTDTATVQDVMVGDVYLCSGQSNMEFSVSSGLNEFFEIMRSGNTNIRMMTVPQQQSLTPQKHFANPVEWQVASRDVVGRWSAACYFYGREIQSRYNVPVGLIHSSWGGSNLRTWLRASSVRQIGGFDDQMDVLELQAVDPAAASRKWGDSFATWWEKTGGEGKPWESTAADIAKWKLAGPVNTHWDNWEDPVFHDYNGAAWMAISFKLTKAQAAQSGVLNLGQVDDVDQTWLNGKPIGYTAGGAPRNYAFAAGSLKAGDNVVILNVLDVYANGGMYGPGPRELKLADGTVVPLETGWRYNTVAQAQQFPPRAPWDTLGGLTIIGNAMIQPIKGYGLKGVLWYQGESNTDDSIASYKKQLHLLFADWRELFGDDVSFLVVQLANYGPRPTKPSESGWANVREAQRLAVLEDKSAGLAVAVDIGDPRDIHPADKTTLGKRLAIAGRSVIYGEDIPASGPVPVSAQRQGDKVVVQFDDVVDELITYSSTSPIGFELCDANGCTYVFGTLKGKTVELSGVADATKVRYCWADSPICTLYDKSDAPAGPFEIAVKP